MDMHDKKCTSRFTDQAHAYAKNTPISGRRQSRKEVPNMGLAHTYWDHGMLFCCSSNMGHNSSSLSNGLVIAFNNPMIFKNTASQFATRIRHLVKVRRPVVPNSGAPNTGGSASLFRRASLTAQQEHRCTFKPKQYKEKADPADKMTCFCYIFNSYACSGYRALPYSVDQLFSNRSGSSRPDCHVAALQLKLSMHIHMYT